MYAAVQSVQCERRDKSDTITSRGTTDPICLKATSHRRHVTTRPSRRVVSACVSSYS